MKQPGDLERLMIEPTIDVLTAARLLGVAKDTAYAAVKKGDIPAIRVGGLFRVPSAPLLRMLGLPLGAAAAVGKEAA